MNRSCVRSCPPIPGGELLICLESHRLKVKHLLKKGQMLVTKSNETLFIPHDISRWRLGFRVLVGTPALLCTVLHTVLHFYVKRFLKLQQKAPGKNVRSGLFLTLDRKTDDHLVVSPSSDCSNAKNFKTMTRQKY